MMDSSQHQQHGIKPEDGVEAAIGDDQENCRVRVSGVSPSEGLVGMDGNQMYVNVDSKSSVQHFRIPSQQDDRSFEVQTMLPHGNGSSENAQHQAQCVDRAVQHAVGHDSGLIQNPQQEDVVLPNAVPRQHAVGQTQDMAQDSLFNQASFRGGGGASAGTSFAPSINNVSHGSGMLTPEQSCTPVLVTRSSFAKGSKGPLVCHVQGCNRDLSQEKKYYMRYRVCMEHLKMNAIVVDGELARFCQQCGRFHELSKFDGQKRNCRDRLSQHNRRRRKSKWESIAGTSDGSWDGTPGTPDVKVPRGPRSKRQSQGLDRHRGSGGFWDINDGQPRTGAQNAVDVNLSDKGQSPPTMVQGPYAVGQPSTTVLGTVEGIPVTQGFRRAPAQLGGSRSAFKQFADGNVNVPQIDAAQRTESIYEMLLHQQQVQPNQAQQALMHMAHPNLTGRTADGVTMDGLDRTNSAHLSGIPQMPMLIIPAASAAEIMQHLRGSAVALIPTSGPHGGVPLPLQSPKAGSQSSEIPGSLQWNPQTTMPPPELNHSPGLQFAPGLLPGMACMPNMNPTTLSPVGAIANPTIWGSPPTSTSTMAAPALHVLATPSSVSVTPAPLENNQSKSMNVKIEGIPSESLAVGTVDTVPMSMEMERAASCHQLATSYSPGQQAFSHAVLAQAGGLPNPVQCGSDRFYDLQKMVTGEGLPEPSPENNGQCLAILGNDLPETTALPFSSFLPQNDNLEPRSQSPGGCPEVPSARGAPLSGGSFDPVSVDNTTSQSKKLQPLTASSLEQDQAEVWGSKQPRPTAEAQHGNSSGDMVSPPENT